MAGSCIYNLTNTENTIEENFESGDSLDTTLSVNDSDEQLDDVPQEVDLCNIGSQLRKGECGGFLSIEENGTTVETLYYVRTPPVPELVILQPGTVVLAQSSLLKSLCELRDNARELGTSWICQRKDLGRFLSTCSHSGGPRKSSSKGMRERGSKKVGCEAKVTTTSIHMSYQQNVCDYVISSIKKDCESYRTKAGLDLDQFHLNSFCVIRNINMSHTNHVPKKISSGKKLISRSRDVLENEEIMSALLAFRRACPGGKGSVMKLERFLGDQFPRCEIEYETLRNVVKKISEGEEDANNLVKYLQQRKREGKVEFLDHHQDEETGELSSIVWSVKGSKELVHRCGDVIFWDSTHNTTRYNYRLATMTAVDSEGVSRAVLLGLTLHENGLFCRRLLGYWHIAFEKPLPEVIFTDGDEAIALSLRSIPYDEDVRHLLCIYHLFDMQVKKRVNPILRSKGKYLDLYVWDRRNHWASVFFKDCLTLGASSTQRSESWNSLVRCFADSTSLQNYASSIEKLIERQSRKESRSSCPEWRVLPLREAPGHLREHCASFLGKLGVSRYACTEIARLLNEALRLTFTSDSDVPSTSGLEGREKDEHKLISIAGTTTQTYSFDQNEGNERTLSRTDVYLRVILPRTPSEGKTPDVTATCECLYTVRMGLPCHHLLAVCLYLDKSKTLMETMKKKGYHSFIDILFLTSVSPRWISPFGLPANETEFLIAHRRKYNFDDWDARKLEQLDIWLLQCGIRQRFALPRQTDFPISLADGGSQKAFSLIRAVFTRVSEHITFSESALPAGAIVYKLGVMLENETKNLQHYDSGQEFGKTPLLRRLSALLEEIHSSEDSCGYSGSTTRTSLQNTTPLMEMNGNDTLKQSQKSSEESSYELSFTGSSVANVRNPQRRHDWRKRDCNTTLSQKTRAARRRRKRQSRKLRLALRNNKTNLTLFEAKIIAEGYACPLCDDIGVQKESKVVFDHFREAHWSYESCLPTIMELKQARKHRDERHGVRFSVKDCPSTTAQQLNLSKACMKARNNIPLRCKVSQRRHMMATPNTFEDGITDRLQVGARVELFWALDLEWYPGEIMYIDNSNGELEFGVLYEDGDKEHVTNILKKRWRVIDNNERSSMPSLDIPQDLLEAYNGAMDVVNAEEKRTNPRDIFVVRGERNISRLDFRSLKDGLWLTDKIIEDFVLHMMRTTVHTEGKRFLYVSTFAVPLVDRPYGIGGGEKWLNGFQFHDIDYILWPVHVNESHWVLCIVEIQTQTYRILDPFHVRSRFMGNKKVSKQIKDTLNHMSAKYSKLYGKIFTWKELAPRDVAIMFQLVEQPVTNGTDCGVLVCMYAWTLLVGKAFKSTNVKDKDHRGFERYIQTARKLIGGRLAATQI
ncbi:Ubiquitin-like protease [Gracilaria domingensis]|nr:Ubiquitin-like protease [Gracilaria domingensis]